MGQKMVALPLLRQRTSKDEMTEHTSPYRTWGKSRSLRLKDFDYTSPWVVYHIIIRSNRNRNMFSSSISNQIVVETLKKSVKLYGYRLLCFCLMPNHLHILIQAGESPKDLRNLVRGFKSFSSKSTRKRLWQRSFYEHVLRKEENVVEVARYVLDNPIRKQIVEEYKEYRWCELMIDEYSVASPEVAPEAAIQGTRN